MPKQQKQLFEIIHELHMGFHVLVSNNLVETKQHPSGGLVTMGVPAEALQAINTAAPDGKSEIICLLVMVDREAYEQYATPVINLKNPKS